MKVFLHLVLPKHSNKVYLIGLTFIGTEKNNPNAKAIFPIMNGSYV
jgi:hypothetical protein